MAIQLPHPAHPQLLGLPMHHTHYLDSPPLPFPVSSSSSSPASSSFAMGTTNTPTGNELMGRVKTEDAGSPELFVLTGTGTHSTNVNANGSACSPPSLPAFQFKFHTAASAAGQAGQAGRPPAHHDPLAPVSFATPHSHPIAAHSHSHPHSQLQAPHSHSLSPHAHANGHGHQAQHQLHQYPHAQVHAHGLGPNPHAQAPHNTNSSSSSGSAGSGSVHSNSNSVSPVHTVSPTHTASTPLSASSNGPLSASSTGPLSASALSNSGPLYRFGSAGPYPGSPFVSSAPTPLGGSHPHSNRNNLVNHNQLHSPNQHLHHNQYNQNTLQGHALSPLHNQNTPNQFFLAGVDPAMSYSDDYDDGAAAHHPPTPAVGAYGLGGLGGSSGVNSGLGNGGGGGANGGSANDRIVRRRSSKACDQCRKSKCKCERASLSEPCKNCVMLGTPCTFLGPSRKRGPPKGYIDAIEARLHQTEALLGILLATEDARARGLLRDIGEDPLAREIIARVDNSPYGVKGRKRDVTAPPHSSSTMHDGSTSLTVNGNGKDGVNGKMWSAQSSEASLALNGNREKGDMDMDMDEDREDEKGGAKVSGQRLDLTSTHPSNEWQDRVATMLDAVAKRRGTLSSTGTKARRKAKDTLTSSAKRRAAKAAGKGAQGKTESGRIRSESDNDGGDGDEGGIEEEEDDGDNDEEDDEEEDEAEDEGEQEEVVKPSNSRRSTRTLDPLNTNLGTSASGSTYAQTQHHHQELATSSSAPNLNPHSQPQPQQTQGYSPYSHSSDGASPGAQARRTRRRLGDPAEGNSSSTQQVYVRSAPGSAVSLQGGAYTKGTVPRTVSSRSPVALASSMHWGERGRRGSGWAGTITGGLNAPADVDMGGLLDRRSTSVDDYREQGGHYPELSEESEDEGALVAGAVGQLSLNEDEQVRYHGKASGLYLLDGRGKERRNEGGIWRFPKARVWPALPSASSMSSIGGELHRMPEAELPPPNIREHLLDLYFTYVQPVFPIVHKRVFLEGYRAMYGADSPSSPADPSGTLSGTTQTDIDETGGETSPFGSRPARRRRAVPTLLLLAMFALASRYCDSTRGGAAPPQPADPSTMWSAGDEYLDRAKMLLDSSYASSRPSTVQALLLLGYREIGIGAMAQAWTYIGMGIRMAQDLGMHRAADGWERVGLGGRLFDKEEISERRRVWFGCVIMDKYVSTYIGRPLMIFEWDFDTTLPDEEDPEEYDEWSVETGNGERSPRGVPGRSISCFNASAKLSNILSNIVQAIYAVRPYGSRHTEAAALEGLLDKWYLELPAHLRFDVASTSTSAPLPNVLTLHMQYWTAVLLLHRPFIRHVLQAKQRSQQQQGGEGTGQGVVGTGLGEDPETRAIAVKRYELCNAAANHITSIVSLYQEKYLITRCSVFLCYYVFTAGIMHDTNLVVHPNDPQAKIGLAKCLNVLRAMRVVWPSAARAIELFGGTSTMEDANSAANPLVGLTMIDRHKRAAENALDDSSPFDYMPSLRQPLHLQQQHLQQQYQHQHQHQHQRHQHQQQHQHATYPQQEQTSNNFADDGLFLPTLPPMNTTGSGMVTASGGYATPWQDPHHFNAPLSTAVLPQLYSTGLVDDGMHHASPSIVRGGVGISGGHSEAAPASSSSGAGGHGRRYPQYMDYAGYSQMAVSTYDLPEGVQVSQQAQQQHQIYLSDQYNLYNNQSYNNR